MKICVVGAGAIGGVIAAYFARAGFETSVVARGAHLHAIEARGLTVTTPTESFTAELRANDDANAFTVQDVIFIGLKAHQIPALLPGLKAIVGPETVVVPAINGVPWWYFFRERGAHDGSHIESVDPGGAALRALDPHHVIGCVVHAAAEVVGPGEIRSNGNRSFVLGEPDGSLSRRLNGLADAMRRAGHEPKITEQIREEVWMKLIGNTSFNPIAALTRATLRDICDNAGLVVMIRAVMEEMNRISAALGVREIVSLDKRLALAHSVGPVKPSMLQDLERGRAMEIEPIIGAVVELATRVGVAVPRTEFLYAMMKELEKNLQRGTGSA